MHNDTDVIERGQSIRKHHKLNHTPYRIALAVIAVAFVIVVAASIGKAIRAKKSGVMEATYTARSLESGMVEAKPVKAPQKFNHIIFRLGDDEIFRFTYEDNGENLRYSFEVREGGS